MFPIFLRLSRRTATHSRVLESLVCATCPFNSSSRQEAMFSSHPETLTSGSISSVDSGTKLTASIPSPDALPQSTPNSSVPPKGSNLHLMMDSRANTPLKNSDYASSHDDIFGVQRNWFTALYKQLNYMNNTGMVQGSFKGRQREVFESVEKEFEVLYERYLMGSDLKGVEHRAVLMVCLAVATHRLLSEEIGDPNVVREIIRTNQGSMMMAFLLPVHRFKIWLLRYLLAEDPFKQAVGFLPALQADMGGLCEAEVVRGPLRSTTQQEDKGSSRTTTTESQENLDNTASSSSSEPSVSSPSTSSSQSTGFSTPSSNSPQINSSASFTYYNGSNHGSGSDTSKGPQKQAAGRQENEVSLVVTKCKYHEILTREDTPFLLSEFCCQHGMIWMKDFQRHGVEVGFERSRSWEDDCCVLRVAKRM